MTFLRRLDSRAALRFCSSLVSRAFLLAAEAVAPELYVLRMTCSFSSAVFNNFAGGAVVVGGRVLLASPLAANSSFLRFREELSASSCVSLGCIMTGAILDLFQWCVGYFRFRRKFIESPQ